MQYQLLAIVSASLYTLSVAQLSDYTCQTHNECFAKYKSATCCVQISCNSGYKFYRFTSGCAKIEHCVPITKYNSETGQFSARMPFESWKLLQSQLGSNLQNCDIVRETVLPLIDNLSELIGQIGIDQVFADGLWKGTGLGPTFPPKPEGATPTQFGEYCKPSKDIKCRAQEKFCCTRVTCSDNVNDYKLEEVCVLPGGCGLKKERGRRIRGGPYRYTMWFNGSMWEQPRVEFENSAYHMQGLNVIGSCSETRSFVDFLKAQARKLL